MESKKLPGQKGINLFNSGDLTLGLKEWQVEVIKVFAQVLKCQCNLGIN